MCAVYSAHEPQEDPLGSQQKRTFCFFSPKVLFVVCVPLKGLSRLPQELRVVSFSSAQDLALAQDSQGAEQGEEEGSLGVWTCWLLGG